MDVLINSPVQEKFQFFKNKIETLPLACTINTIKSSKNNSNDKQVKNIKKFDFGFHNQKISFLQTQFCINQKTKDMLGSNKLLNTFYSSRKIENIVKCRSNEKAYSNRVQFGEKIPKIIQKNFNFKNFQKKSSKKFSNDRKIQSQKVFTKIEQKSNKDKKVLTILSYDLKQFKKHKSCFLALYDINQTNKNSLLTEIRSKLNINKTYKYLYLSNGDISLDDCQKENTLKFYLNKKHNQNIEIDKTDVLILANTKHKNIFDSNQITHNQKKDIKEQIKFYQKLFKNINKQNVTKNKGTKQKQNSDKFFNTLFLNSKQLKNHYKSIKKDQSQINRLTAIITQEQNLIKQKQNYRKFLSPKFSFNGTKNKKVFKWLDNFYYNNAGIATKNKQSVKNIFVLQHAPDKIKQFLLQKKMLTKKTTNQVLDKKYIVNKKCILNQQPHVQNNIKKFIGYKSIERYNQIEFQDQNIPNICRYLLIYENLSRKEIVQNFLTYCILKQVQINMDDKDTFLKNKGISFKTFYNYFLQFKRLGIEKAEIIFRKINQDQTGYLKFKEFLNSMKIFSAKTIEDKINLFCDIADTDGNNLLSYEEIYFLAKVSLKSNFVHSQLDFDNCQFMEDITQYFTKKIFEVCNISIDKEIPLDIIQNIVIEKKEGHQLLLFFSGMDY